MSAGPTLRAPKVRAGCGRERVVPDASTVSWAYTELAFVECPTCPHRVTPDAASHAPGGGPAFCVWRPVDAPHPFAALGDLDVPD